MIIVWNKTKKETIVSINNKSAIDMSSVEKDKTYTITAGYCTDPNANRPDAPSTVTKGCIYTMRIIEE